MPITHKKDGWYWGSKGPFKTKKKAEQVRTAAYASGYVKKSWQEILKKKYKAPKGVYTKPRLRERIHATLLNENTHGTAAGKWSARKSQELNRRYQKAGGGFVNKK